VSADGETLAMGSSTGGLWVSEDGGRRWQCVSAHLPPIYAVRFAGTTAAAGAAPRRRVPARPKQRRRPAR